MNEGIMSPSSPGFFRFGPSTPLSPGSPSSPFRIKRYGDKRALQRHPALKPPTSPTGEAAFEVTDSERNELASLSPASSSSSRALAPPHQLLHSGNKLFWRVNRTVDFRIFVAEAAGAVVLRSYDSARDCEFPPLVAKLVAILDQIKLEDEAQSALQASMVAIDASNLRPQRDEDELLKERRRKKALAEIKREAEKRRSSVANPSKKDQVEEAQRLKEKSNLWAKVVSFCISRLEVQKAAETGAISTILVKRPNDSFAWDFEEEPPKGVLFCGYDTAWKRKESTSRIHRKSSELAVAVEQTAASTLAADQRQRATKLALDIFKNISDRAHYEKLPKHQQKFCVVLKKALFQQRLEGMQGTLKSSPAYQEFAKSLTR